MKSDDAGAAATGGPLWLNRDDAAAGSLGGWVVACALWLKSDDAGMVAEGCEPPPNSDDADPA